MMSVDEVVMLARSLRLTVVAMAMGALACAVAIHPTVTPEVAHSRMGELWERPSSIPASDLLNGPWGAQHAPDPGDAYTFLRKKRKGANPGVTVRDSQGREWHVKQGVEAQPEVVLSHVLSAVGYHQPPVYYLKSFTIVDEAGRRTEEGGRFRLQDRTLKNRGEWSWDQNPFVGTPPYQGLLVMLVLFNSADLKNDNNSLYELKKAQEGATQWFVVRDLGSSLGEVGRFNPKENRPSAFEEHRFITSVSDGYVNFSYRAVHGNLVQHRIRPDDVVWASRLLSELTSEQWQDAFRGAGYAPDVANRFIQRILQKIQDGQRLNQESRR
jgi:hypothetical protein